MQPSIDQIKSQITESRLTEIQKNDLVGLLPVVGRKTLDFIYKRVSRSNFGEEAEDVCLLLINESKAYQALAHGDFAGTVELLKSAPDNPDYNFGEFVIPFAQDVRQYVQNHSSSEFGQVLAVLNDFEAKIFHWLPETELNEIIKNDLLYFVKTLNIVMEFKRSYLLEELSDDGTWGQTLRAALEANEQQLGKSGLTRDGKNYQPTVANWLKDYIAYINKPLTERVAFDQVQYIERAPNVQRLNVYERKDLLEIIKLHAWLMNPEVTEAEIEGYEADLAKQNTKVSAPAPAPPVIPKPSPLPVSPNDWVKTAQQRRAEEQEKIDEKLKALISREAGSASGGKNQTK